ncbi:DUF397 domain-containing protein [Streptomyces seoulensis]|uniref:DUF397 domain-containing protein n=1 Tax=Streptomyces seoulensis TaxID=73044 RepID=UPI0036BC3B24
MPPLVQPERDQPPGEPCAPRGRGEAHREFLGGEWSKSSHSTGQGGECLEAAFPWRGSSYSSGDGGQCVEIAACPATIHLRDSKQNPLTAPALSLPTTAWRLFLGLVRG